MVGLRLSNKIRKRISRKIRKNSIRGGKRMTKRSIKKGKRMSKRSIKKGGKRMNKRVIHRRKTLKGGENSPVVELLVGIAVNKISLFLVQKNIIAFYSTALMEKFTSKLNKLKGGKWAWAKRLIFYKNKVKSIYDIFKNLKETMKKEGIEIYANDIIRITKEDVVKTPRFKSFNVEKQGELFEALETVNEDFDEKLRDGKVIYEVPLENDNGNPALVTSNGAMLGLSQTRTTVPSVERKANAMYVSATDKQPAAGRAAGRAARRSFSPIALPTQTQETVVYDQHAGTASGTSEQNYETVDNEQSKSIYETVDDVNVCGELRIVKNKIDIIMSNLCPTNNDYDAGVRAGAAAGPGADAGDSHYNMPAPRRSNKSKAAAATAAAAEAAATAAEAAGAGAPLSADATYTQPNTPTEIRENINTQVQALFPWWVKLTYNPISKNVNNHSWFHEHSNLSSKVAEEKLSKNQFLVRYANMTVKATYVFSSKYANVNQQIETNHTDIYKSPNGQFTSTVKLKVGTGNSDVTKKLKSDSLEEIVFSIYKCIVDNLNLPYFNPLLLPDFLPDQLLNNVLFKGNNDDLNWFTAASPPQPTEYLTNLLTKVGMYFVYKRKPTDATYVNVHGLKATYVLIIRVKEGGNGHRFIRKWIDLNDGLFCVFSNNEWTTPKSEIVEEVVELLLHKTKQNYREITEYKIVTQKQQ